MERIERSVELEVEPERVFDLISDVEAFPQYVSILRQVSHVGERHYRWYARVGGLDLEWASRITRLERPHTVAWESLSGIQACGTFTLTPSEVGTRVDFVMEYRLQRAWLERVIRPVARRVARQVIGEVQHQLGLRRP